jgi:hypothetical protein
MPNPGPRIVILGSEIQRKLHKASCRKPEVSFVREKNPKNKRYSSYPQVGVEGDLYCIPKEGSEDEFDEGEEPILSPSKW